MSLETLKPIYSLSILRKKMLILRFFVAFR